MLLIFPPVAKGCEPPAGITHLAGFLRGNGLDCRIWDANLEGQLHLLAQEQHPEDTWSRRAWKNLKENIGGLRSASLYDNNDRYQRAIRDLNRALAQSCEKSAVALTLADHQHESFSPHSSSDLLQAAEGYKEDIFFSLFEKRLPVLLDKAGDNWIGISLNYLSQALPAFALAGYIRKEYPGFKLIIGGGLITSWHRSPAWTDPFGELFDHVVVGRGETELLELLGHPRPNREHAPDFSDLALHDYLSPGLILPYSASTGCYWNRCSFCPEKAEGSHYRKRSDELVVSELRQLSQRYQPRLIHILDNAMAPSLMRQLIETPPGAEWYSFARIHGELGNPRFCRELRESGCVMLKLGIESGSQEVLNSMDKGIDLSQVEKALEALHDAGIATYVYLLFGTPGEDLKEARKTLEFTARNAQFIDFLNLAIFNLPRNSEEAQGLALQNFSGGDLHLYSDFQHPRGWDRKKVRRFLNDEFKSHPAIRPILQRDPPFFTSNHAPLVVHSRKRAEAGLT